MDVRSLLFGSILRIAVTAVLGIGVVAGGAVVTGLVGVPGIAAMDNDFGDVNETVTPVNTELVVHNPNPIGVRLGYLTVNYSVEMNDVTMATGTKSGIAIDTGNTTLHLTTFLQNERIPDWWMTHIRNGERTTLVVNADIHSGLLGRTVHYQTGGQTITTDLISQFNSTADRPVDSGIAVVSDPLFWINRTSATWGEVTTQHTPLGVEFLVHNPKDGPLGVSKIGYNITMNGIPVGSGELRKGVFVPSHSSTVVNARMLIQNQRLDEWWVSHLKNDQITELRIDFYAVIEPPVSGADEIRVPIPGLTYTHTIETGIFQDPGNETATDDGTGDGEQTTTTGGSTTATTGDTTTTPTTSGETTTDDTTTTEDDGIFAISRGVTFKASATS